MAKKIKKGYYPISYKDLNSKIISCECWGYGNKATCKYVAETIIENLQMDYPDLHIKDTLYGELIGIAHDLAKGFHYTGKLLIKIED